MLWQRIGKHMEGSSLMWCSDGAVSVLHVDSATSGQWQVHMSQLPRSRFDVHGPLQLGASRQSRLMKMLLDFQWALGPHNNFALPSLGTGVKVQGFSSVCACFTANMAFFSQCFFAPHCWTFEDPLLLLHRHRAMQREDPGTFTFSKTGSCSISSWISMSSDSWSSWKTHLRLVVHAVG